MPWNIKFPAVGSNTKTFICGITLGFSLATFLGWIYASKKKQPIEEKHVNSNLDEITLRTKPSHSLGPGSRVSVSSMESSTRQRFHQLPKGDDGSSPHRLSRLSSVQSSASNQPPMSHMTLQSVDLYESQVAGRGEIARLGVFAIHQVIIHLQDALSNLERLSKRENNLPEETYEDTVSSLAESDITLVNEDGETTHFNQGLRDRHLANISMAESDSVLAELKSLLEQAVLVYERCKQEMTTVVTEYNPAQSELDNEAASEVESFVSALEYIDLSDLQVQLIACSADDHLYKAALIELDHGNVMYRDVRTALTGCSSDTEYLAKLHCIRLAFDHIVRVPEKREYIIDVGCRSVSYIMESMRYSTAEFKEAFRILCDYVADVDNQKEVFETLESRGVAVVNMYDVVFDYLLLDGLQKLEDPPSSLMTVIQNRWLTDSFKKTALDSVVWTLLLAKKKLVKNPQGFTNHFYALLATLGPAFCWGFLGSDPQANAVCSHLRECIMDFLTMMYGPQTRFTCVEELSDDIITLARKYLEGKLMTKFPLVSANS